MSTPHISAPDGAFAKTMLMPGDPLRAKFMAENFIDDAELVTSVRNIFGYTGTYHGVPISIMASGMGMPSIGIYSHELYSYYGVENIVRIGSAGSYNPELNVMDVFLGDSAYSASSYAMVHNGTTSHTLYPSKELNDVIKATAVELGIPLKTGVIHSSDVFYTGAGSRPWQEVREETGVDCVEMESFALFHNANYLGRRAACLLTISDSLVKNEELTALERQESFRTMMRLALESAIRF